MKGRRFAKTNNLNPVPRPSRFQGLEDLRTKREEGSFQWVKTYCPAQGGAAQTRPSVIHLQGALVGGQAESFRRIGKRAQFTC